MDSINLLAFDVTYPLPKKKIKDTTLLIPVVLDLLSNSLPRTDTSYQNLSVYPVQKTKPTEGLTEELLLRTNVAFGGRSRISAPTSTRIRLTCCAAPSWSGWWR